jgi:hypothetical protein
VVQTVGRRPLTEEALFVSGPVLVGFMVDKVQVGKIYLRLLQFPPTSVIILMLRTHFTDRANVYQDKRTRSAYLPRKHCAFGNKGTSRYQTAVPLFLRAS